MLKHIITWVSVFPLLCLNFCYIFPATLLSRQSAMSLDFGNFVLVGRKIVLDIDVVVTSFGNVVRVTELALWIG